MEGENNRVIRVTKLLNGESVIYERDYPRWKNPLIITTELNQDTGKAYIRFWLYTEYADVHEVEPPPESLCLVTYEPAPEVIQARDQYLENYRFERGQQEAKKKNGGSDWDTSGKITPLH